MSYGDTHARAYETVSRKGAYVRFRLDDAGELNPTTGVRSGATVRKCAGVAVEDGGDPERYAALGLTETEAKTLLFVPRIYGHRPELLSEVKWGGEKYTVRDVGSLAPDGTPITFSVVVAR